MEWLISFTLEYRINGGGGGVRIIRGGLEIVRYNNNRGVGIIGGGGLLEKQKIVVFLVNKYLLHIYVNSDVTDTFIFEPWFC